MPGQGTLRERKRNQRGKTQRATQTKLSSGGWEGGGREREGERESCLSLSDKPGLLA